MTYQQAYLWTTQTLPSDFEAWQLFSHVTGLNRLELMEVAGEHLPEKTRGQLEQLARRRQQGEPLQYLLGQWEFYGLPLDVGEGVLIPRGDTETLVDVALELVEDHLPDHPTLLDLCAGSGAIGLAIAHETGQPVTAVELSDPAFVYLERNISRNQLPVTAVKADVLTYQHSKPIDLIVSNPPYIPLKDLLELQVEVQKEPVVALAGGVDGLDFYRAIPRHYYAQLAPGGWLCFEVGIDQAQPVKEIMEQAGYTALQVREDFGRIPRVVWGQKPREKEACREGTAKSKQRHS